MIFLFFQQQRAVETIKKQVPKNRSKYFYRTGFSTSLEYYIVVVGISEVITYFNLNYFTIFYISSCGIFSRFWGYFVIGSSTLAVLGSSTLGVLGSSTFPLKNACLEKG